MCSLLLAVGALPTLVAPAGGAPSDARAATPVPEPVKRAIVARFPDTHRFYFPRALPDSYRYSHWERVERERFRGERSLGIFTIYFAPPGQTWIETMRADGRWARWRQARALAPCGEVYRGARHATIGGRRVFYVGGRRRGTAAFCERGYAVELTLNRSSLRPLAVMRLVARAALVER